MANDGTIQSKLQLDGEQQYKKALNDAYRSLRVLRSELKAETAELGRNASEQDKARAKMQSLQKQIQQQEKIVKTLEKALADSKKEYADNQEVQDKWAEKLNKARAALADMQNQLGACDDSLSKFSSEMKSVADSSGQAMQTVVSFNDAMKSVGSIVSGIGSSLEGMFSATLDTMRDMVEEMFNLMSLAWSAAGDWKDIQAIWGGDLESIERVYTAMGLQGIDASEITGGLQKFVTNVHNGNKDTMAALQQLGLAESQFSNHWDFFVAVMDKASMYHGQDKYNLMTALFGDKKGSGMTNVLDNWREAMGRYEKDVESTGLKLTSPEIEELDKVSHKIQEIQALWTTLKTNIGAKLSKILNMDDLSEDVLNLLRTIGAILNSEGETRAELVLQLSDNLTTLITGIESALNNLSGFLKELGGDLEKSDNPLVRFIGQLITGLSGILDWLSTHGEEITNFLEAVMPWILRNKISEAVTGKGIGDWFTDILGTGLQLFTLSKVWSSLGAGAGATAGVGTGLGAGLAAKAGGFNNLLGGVSGMVNSAPYFDWFFNNTNLGRSITGQQTWEETGKAFSDYFSNIFSSENWNNFLDNWNPNSPNANPIAKLFRGTGALYNPTTLEEADMRPSYMKGWDNNETYYEWLRKNSAIWEDEDLGGGVDQEDVGAAIQDWWDARRNAENGIDSWDKESAAFNWMQEVLSDQFGTFWDRFLEESEGKDLRDMEDIPADWYADIRASLRNLTKDNYNGMSDENLPDKIGNAVGNAVKRQPVHVVVQLEGQTLLDYMDQGMGGRLGALFG